MNEKNRLLALLHRFREQSWAAAAIDALRSPLCILSETSGDNPKNPQRDHFLKIYLRRRDHLARLGVAAAGLDQFLVGLSTLPAAARITGSSFSGGGFAVKAFYGPHGELIGCITLQQRQRDVPPNLGISPRKPITYPFMLDVAWIASDAHGQVGIFTRAAEARSLS
jgi:hypothetical protein